MKKIITLTLFSCLYSCIFSQGIWTPKTACPTSVSAYVSFTLNSLGYMYTGTATNNFYAYDPIANTWTPKADFPGVARYGAAGFSTDSFGYIGTGSNSSSYLTAMKDFYKYDPVANAWTSITNYPDSGVAGAFSFAINNVGYVVGGTSDTGAPTYKKGYSYDPSTNTWASIASLPIAMSSGFSAVVSGLGYCGFGHSPVASSVLDSVYSYNPSSNSWTKLAGDSLATTSITWTAFVLFNQIYVYDNAAYGVNIHGGIRIYDPVANSWTRINSFPYPYLSSCNPVYQLAGFSLGTSGYLATTNYCTGSTFWKYDTAGNFAISAVSPDSICQNDSFTVTFASGLAYNSGNYFKVKIQVPNYASLVTDSVAGTADGTYTFKLPANAYIGSFNPASLSVVSTSPPAESQYTSQSFNFKSGPTAIGMPFAYNTCGGSALLVYSTANGSYDRSVWTSNPPGLNDTIRNLSYTPTNSAVLYVHEINTTTGCSIIDSTHVILNNHPALNIADSAFSICDGTSATLGGTATPNCEYIWTGGINSNSVNPTVSPTTHTVYHLMIKDTLTYCSVLNNTVVDVKYAPNQTICFVTVDSASTHNVVVWEKLDKYATDSFYIYRETSTNVYTQIGAIQRDSLSQYDDYAANPNITAYRYKIGVRDTCGNTDSLSPYHNTIHLQYLGGGNLIWNVYEIENATSTPVLSFDVYIDSLANGNWTILVNVPGNQYTATDINYSMHPTARYRISANWAYSCTPTRSANNAVLSNVIQLTPNGIAQIGADQSISLYPNPAKNELMVICGAAQVDQVSILSAEGKLVSDIVHPLNNRIDVSQLADGIYIAEIKVNGATERIKWIKM